MTVVRRIGDTWVIEDSGRRIAQAETRIEAEALEAQWLAYWGHLSDLASCRAASPARKED